MVKNPLQNLSEHGQIIAAFEDRHPITTKTTTHACAHALTYVCTHERARAHARTHMHTHSAHAHTFAHTRAHTRMHTCARTSSAFSGFYFHCLSCKDNLLLKIIALILTRRTFL